MNITIIIQDLVSENISKVTKDFFFSYWYCFLPSLVEIGFLNSHSFEEIEKVKSLQTDGLTTGDQKSTLELSVQVS